MRIRPVDDGPFSDPAPEPGGSAWERNARASLFAKDYLASTTRDRIPIAARLGLDLLFLSMREGGSLAADAPVLRDARTVAPGLVEALFEREGDRLVFRNDWLDLPERCASSRRFSDKQRERVAARWRNR